MGVAVAVACKIYAGAYDISGALNKVTVDQDGAELNGRVFGNTAGNTVVGLYKPKVSAQGFVTFGTGAVHANVRANLGTSDVPITVSPETGAAGDVAVFLNAIETSYKLGDQVGEILPFTLEARGKGTPAIGGRVFVAAVAKTVTGVSIIQQLGPVAAGQAVYAALHVLSVSGTNPTLDVTVKSDALVGFGSPLTQLTFPQAVAAGHGWQLLAGANTDGFWRVDYTIGGTATPTFAFVVSVGVF